MGRIIFWLQKRKRIEKKKCSQCCLTCRFYKEWKKRLAEIRQKPSPWETKESVARFEEIVGILERVIAEREKID